MPILIKVLADNLPEQRFLEAILRHRPYWDAIKIDSGLGGTSILSIGSSSIIREPDRPVAMVLNSETISRPALRRLRKSIDGYMPETTEKNWHVALAIPKVDAWALVDDRIRRAFESDPVLRDDRYNRAIAIGQLTSTESFDVESLRRADEEFRLLDDFLERSALPAPRPRARARPS